MPDTELLELYYLMSYPDSDVDITAYDTGIDPPPLHRTAEECNRMSCCIYEAQHMFDKLIDKVDNKS